MSHSQHFFSNRIIGHVLLLDTELPRDPDSMQWSLGNSNIDSNSYNIFLKPEKCSSIQVVWSLRTGTYKVQGHFLNLCRAKLSPKKRRCEALAKKKTGLVSSGLAGL